MLPTVLCTDTAGSRALFRKDDCNEVEANSGTVLRLVHVRYIAGIV